MSFMIIRHKREEIRDVIQLSYFLMSSGIECTEDLQWRLKQGRCLAIVKQFQFTENVLHFFWCKAY
jgi:hypothetical protein